MARLTVDEGDEPVEVVILCRECDEREFGDCDRRNGA